MAGLDDAELLELRTEFNRLILRRTRVMLCFGLGAVAAFTLANHLWSTRPPLWTDVMNLIMAASIGVAFVGFRLPLIQRRPVPFVLLIFTVGTAARALAGVWHGDVAPTAIILVTLALTTAATLPWGLGAQIAVATIATGAIGLNSYLVDGNFGPPPGHAAATVVVGMVVSVALAVELQRHRVQMHVDNLRRRQAEARLALLNAELEQRVMERTSQLATAKQRLERDEAELRRSEAALSALVENTTDAIWSVDRQGIIRVMNSVFRALCRQRFGAEYDPETFAALVPTPIRNDFAALYARAFRGEHAQVERTFEADGERRHLLISVHPIIDNGVVSGATVFSKDITDHKRAEEQARQHQAELAHVLRLSTMGEMAAGLAHEIHQPLCAIANYAQGCARRLRDRAMDVSVLLPVVEAIAAEALRAGEIIRRLRDLLRKEGPHQEVVDINGIVRGAIRMIEPEARRHDVHLQLELAPDLPEVIGDGVQIEQVLLNLLLNGVEAVQAAHNGERSLVVITAPAGADAVEVSVRDSGIGIPDPPADVFAPFFSTKPNGLGMGLSISRTLIETHGGRLFATRNPDHGSTFRFTLPVPGREA